jgi:hypothetical protein
VQIQKLRPSADEIHALIFSRVFMINQKRIKLKSEIDSLKIHDQICTQVSYIEKHCARRKGTPADLSTPSYRIYLWLRFLSHQENFDQHLNAISEFLNTIIQYDRKIRVDPNHLLIKINFSSYLYRRQTIANKTILQINEAFISSPISIKDFIISAAFSRSTIKKKMEIKSFANSIEYKRVNQLISGEPIANHISCCGERYDLSILFKKINMEYFQEQLPQPRLIWTSRRAIRRLGYYHDEINTIAINKKLDEKNISQILVEYVLFHEMLHQYIGIKTYNGRRYSHTATFKKEEKKFKNYKEAENLIKLL